MKSTVNDNYLYYATISPTGVCVTRERLYDPDRCSQYYYNKHDIKLESNKVKGDISNASIIRMKRAFNLLLAISPLQTIKHPDIKKPITFRLNFITLTLSAKQNFHTDKEIKSKLLNHFLVEAKRKFHVKHYIWKAEPQKNGNIHFHINTNVFIHYQALRDTWNNIQNKLEFVNIFNEKFNHSNPNSTDIKSVYKDAQLASYMAKYMSKGNEDRRKITGKIWDCSRSLKPKFSCQIECYDNDYNELMSLYDKCNDRVIEKDFFDFIPLKTHEIQQFLPSAWYEKYENYLQNVKDSI